ncbi:hypothetical protein PoB_000092300 [Plakobranchus ocellatus]|uniref:Uncharacterized protein n=1 Tax=Plakobranchus ocellatus TaxID=259542 RepID=A0AAV3XVN4_9GAST|nr:hypothetical protein PoB_000092300 [Plakobranchus ocellatus]
MKTLYSDIVITNIQGKNSVVTIRMTAEKILDQFWKQQKESETSTEKFRIIYTAAKLILADIPVHIFSSSKTDISLKYEKLQDFRFEDITKKLDLLWNVSWPLRTLRIGWSGLMQTVSEGSYPGQSTITFLPMIDIELRVFYSPLCIKSSSQIQGQACAHI